MTEAPKPSSRESNRSQRVELLEHYPELARSMGPRAAATARRALVVEARELSEGPWVPSRHEPHPGHLGYLVLEGLIMRELVVARAGSIELLGRGDLLQPWLEDSASFCTPRWWVLSEARIAILDRACARQLVKWPEVGAALLTRALQRSRTMAVQAAIQNTVGLEKRLLMMFWHLAERLGRLDQGEVVVPLRLTHQLLSEMVGARRPSVTAALNRLARTGKLVRTTGGQWLLRGKPLTAGEDPLAGEDQLGLERPGA